MRAATTTTNVPSRQPAETAPTTRLQQRYRRADQSDGELTKERTTYRYLQNKFTTLLSYRHRANVGSEWRY